MVIYQTTPWNVVFVNRLFFCNKGIFGIGSQFTGVQKCYRRPLLTINALPAYWVLLSMYPPLFFPPPPHFINTSKRPLMSPVRQAGMGGGTFEECKQAEIRQHTHTHKRMYVRTFAPWYALARLKAHEAWSLFDVPWGHARSESLFNLGQKSDFCGNII